MMHLDAPKDFVFQDEHGLLRDQARKWLADHAGIERLRTLAEDDVGYDRGLWSQMAELGWLGLNLSEDVGGAGLGLLPMALLLEQMGEQQLAGPFLTHVLAAAAIQTAGTDEQQKRWLPGLADGTQVATLALLDASSSWELDGVAASVRRDGDGFVLNGLKPHLDWASAADLLVAPFRDDAGELSLFVVAMDATGVGVQAEDCVDISRRTARVTLDDVRVGPEARLGGGDTAALSAVHSRGHLLLAAEMLGGMERALTLTRDYAAERVQFGRKIGSFQAVKHPIVNIMLDCEHTRSLVYAAAAAADARMPSAPVLARMAKAAASDGFTHATDRGVQLHGGFGFTWDCDLHFLFKRALWARATLGDARHHRRHLAALLTDGSASS